MLNKTAILIPTYNELSNIEVLLKRLEKLYPTALKIVIDDNSPDLTWKFVEKLSKTNKKIHLIKREKKEGLGKAYLHAYRKVIEMKGVEYIVQMDADLSHNPEKVKEMIEALKKHDLVVGSRYKNGVNVINWPMKRVLLSYFSNYYVNFIIRTQMSDNTSGFKAFRKKVLQTINLNKIISEGYVFQIEMNYAAKLLGFNLGEVSIVFEDRKTGISKISQGIVVEALINVILLLFKSKKYYTKNI